MKRFVFAVVIFSLAIGLVGEELRPVRDDIGFCWEPRQMDRLVDFLKKTDTDRRDLPPLIAGISPHDDYLYAGPVFYPLFKRIKAKEVVIFGVTHRTPRLKMGDPHNKLVFDTYSYWIGPYGKVEVSGLREFLKTNLDPALQLTDDEAHREEHSIESLVPWLQHFNRDVKITPIMVTGMPFDSMSTISEKVAAAIAVYMNEKNLTPGKDIFFLISADANHYGKDFDNVVYGEDQRAHELATERDKKLAQSFLSGVMDPGKIKGLTGQLWGKTFTDFNDTVWCGKYSIPFGMLTVLHLMKQLEPEKQLNGKLLHYSDTYSGGVLPLKKPGFGITAPFSLKHWVGFFSAGFYLEPLPDLNGHH